MNSYVFYLFRPHPGENPLTVIQQKFPPDVKPALHSMDAFKHDPQEAPRVPTGVVDPDLDDPETLLEHSIEESDRIRDGLAKMKFDLAQMLSSRNPDLQYPEAVTIAIQVGTSLESACRPFRELTLRATATNNVQIDLYDFGARISIPFSIIGDEVRQIFGEVWEYIHLLKRSSDYLAYDPQLGRMIKNTADMILAMTGYEYLYTENLKAESKSKGLFPPDADEFLPDDATQPLRAINTPLPDESSDNLESPSESQSFTPPPPQAPDDTGERSVAAGSSTRADAERHDSQTSGSSRKTWWKFW